MRRRAAVTTKKENNSLSTRNVRMPVHLYIDFWTKNKDLLLAPLATMVPQLFSLPLFILSFSLSCQEFKTSWQRYLLVISYFILYLPQMLLYKLYVSPSSFYKEEFHSTTFSQRISQLLALLTRKTTENTRSTIQSNKCL